ncbi:MAG: hypothetical protein ACXVQX_08730 [Actinomycetota bacterium]
MSKRRRSEAKISPTPTPPGGLSQATEQIAGLLEELTTTVESAEQLTRMGEPEEALRLVEEQRVSLYSTVDEISRTVGAPRSSFRRIRTRTPLVAAASLLVVSGFAISVAALTGPSGPQQARAQLQRAERIEDPAVRLRAIYNTYKNLAASNPGAVAPGTELNTDIQRALTKTSSDAQGDPQQQQVLDQTAKWLQDISTGTGLTPPSPAPSASPPPSPSPVPSPSTPPPPGGSGLDRIFGK